jgi:hypothetical protein
MRRSARCLITAYPLRPWSTAGERPACEFTFPSNLLGRRYVANGSRYDRDTGFN